MFSYKIVLKFQIANNKKKPHLTSYKYLSTTKPKILKYEIFFQMYMKLRIT